MRARRLVALCVALGACGGPNGDAPPVAGDSLPAAPGPATPGAADSADPVARFRALLPDSAFTRRGACPFECCTYGEWRATAEIPVRAEQRGTGAPVFTLRSGDRFRADSGTVHIRDVLLVAVHDSVGDPPYWSFVPGDTLVILDYVGEGRYHAWQGGRIQEVEGFWGAERMPLVSEMIGRWESEWWVHVTLADGRSGWIDASPPGRFSGADACAGP